ncbi:hypothetical protein [Sebaldella sp. S0638]|uniref:hypothetical protein n=1 Tax=Sebaldella sp. S0638 TaxID=2957809 RepID=UPI0020A14BBF|nr:hypothetical protein [Sebaldella sp. S0638]MCP1224575.1 hypothetical protein [Sebaldella sp. S0638]
MKEIAEIRYTVTADRLMRLYYARYKVNYKEFSQEIYDSRSDSEKEYSDVFFDDRVISQNIVKDEKTTFLYNELYAVDKTDIGYLFYVTKDSLLFYGFDEFEPESLKKLDEILKPYYETEKEEIIAKIENSEYTEDKIRKIMFKRVFNHRLLLVITAYVILISGLFLGKNNTSKLLYILIALGTSIQYLYNYFITPKKTLKSMNNRFLRARVLFYQDRAEIINKSKAEILILKYGEFFKIKEIKYGILFYIQRYKCFLFEYSEIEGDLEKLRKILADNKGSKK